MTATSQPNTLFTAFCAKISLVVAMLVASVSAHAFDLDFYTSNSRLAEGRWVKISVETDGMYQLTPSALRQMGFNDPAAVKVFGRGGRPVELQMIPSLQYDDLPRVQTIRSADGSILFYGEGTAYLSSARRPLNNTYSTVGYYFLTDADIDDLDESIPMADPSTSSANPAKSWSYIQVHEKELIPASTTGSTFIGENFVKNPKQTITLELPGFSETEEQSLSLSYQFISNSKGGGSIIISLDGEPINQSKPDVISPMTAEHAHYSRLSNTHKTTHKGSKIDFTIDCTFSYQPTVAGLDYLIATYDRPIALGADPLIFNVSSQRMEIKDATASTRVLDVTDPYNITELSTTAGSNSVVASTTNSGKKTIVAFNPDSKFLSPKYCGSVANQNIHGADVPDMVIFVPADYITQANRLADRRRNGPDPLSVLVLDQQLVFNEFASGSPDPMAFRKCLKMFYDRSAESNRKLRYALFFGRGSYDNRQLSPEVKNLPYPKMPLWQTANGDSDTDSYTTDDYFAFLEDKSGSSPTSDHYSIAVGRLPVTSTSDAKAAVDKIIAYEESMPVNNWRNRFLFVADDEDGGVHLNQTERMWREANASKRGANTLYEKIYVDFYPREGTTTKANPALKRTLSEGVTYFSYIGHANPTTLTHENLLTYADINSLHLSCYPIVYAATCEFLRWDHTSISGAEIMWKLSTGGAIAVISANRPVFISDNGPLSASFARHCFDMHPDGRPYTIGEIYRATKNDYRKLIGTNGVETGDIQSNGNKLRFVLMGDPSMRPITPANQVIVDAINGIDPADESKQIIIQANQNVVVSGHIANYDGTPLSDFNGKLNATLYDAERSLITLGYGKSGVKSAFDLHGERLFESNDSVKDGIFHIKIPMSSEIANNFRNASINLYAHSSTGVSAGGLENRFYIYGTDENAAPDTIPPVIKSFYLNHRSFTDGAVVNPSPIAIAEITDNRVINIGSAGIGHQISLKLDGGKSYTDVAQYYTPYADGSPGGTIAYPLTDLPEGAHELRLRVWDGSANSANSTIYFRVSDSATPTIYDIYTDANPASVEANFYLSYDRPAAEVEVTLNIYNLLGHKVWSTTRTGRGDMVMGFPINWDLTDLNGRRVSRGIYLYQASVTADGVTSKTMSRKIAVAAQ